MQLEKSNLPSLRKGGGESRTALGAATSSSSIFSRSRRSTSSLLSMGSDAQSSGSSMKGKNQFKPVSYFTEKLITPSTDVVRKFHSIQRKYKNSISAFISEKEQIKVSMERERAHIDTLIQENEEREANIRETLEVLRSTNKTQKVKSKPPSIEQLRKIANTIMREGLKFKKLSENQQRIDKETVGVEVAEDKLDLNQNLGDDSSFDKVMELQRKKLSSIVFQNENSKMKLETTMSNRDMLNRVIFDHNTNKEALKLKMENLTAEGKKLVSEFETKLNHYAKILGELKWKNEVVKECNMIAKLPKSS
ncbi:hypothetical protein TVAG_491260 [Trichomonas vaginalis G3]|uniref:Uncharacterized protein n=1 Tax=Trichomonas vaginalis (strain ATCC PRA-98 / G3) TaxID=412133 RepID=A2E068_TRIV3|nr:hypothetical protein TVAGG3_0219480 [Trichomonas vaginalis G3]EAY13987.1 hypothetical protein TVAG_491260 [Trichomonas vaginalis G3]KAI5551812.1 hypothetical protein TVAGG3_0219480 [Trichomonas vaginalis G3]|eukprot:XP_001326210.1 hypothetical protein [Trichomonas vaginalis G3]